MPIIVDLHTSFGVFDCTIEPDTKNAGHYNVEILIKPGSVEPEGKKIIYHAFFEMRLTNTGRPIIVSNLKFPLADYWLEIQELTANHILANI